MEGISAPASNSMATSERMNGVRVRLSRDGVSFNASAEFGALRAKAGFQVDCTVLAPKVQESQSQCAGQRWSQVMRAGCDDDPRARKITFKFPECIVRLRRSGFRNLIPAVQQEQEWFRALHLREVSLSTP